MMWLPDGEKILMLRLFVLTQSTNVAHTHIHTAGRHRPRLCIASRGKKIIQVRQQDAYPANAGGTVTTIYNTPPPFQGQHLHR